MKSRLTVYVSMYSRVRVTVYADIVFMYLNFKIKIKINQALNVNLLAHNQKHNFNENE